MTKYTLDSEVELISFISVADSNKHVFLNVKYVTGVLLVSTATRPHTGTTQVTSPVDDIMINNPNYMATITIINHVYILVLVRT